MLGKLPILVLDITRSLSRANHAQPTGIDRVESRYFDRILNGNTPAFFLARIPGGQFLLNRQAAAQIRDILLHHQPAQQLDLRAQIAVHRNLRLRQMETLVRSLGLPLARGFAVHKIESFAHLNVGHSNLDSRLVTHLRKLGCTLFVAMIHDTIPLDHPEFSSPASSRRFPKKLAACGMADLVVFNSKHTKERATFWLQKSGHAPVGIVVALGVERSKPSERKPAFPARFMVLGTIEPRKNHRLLLDVWNNFHQTLALDEIPFLDVVGARGWRNADVFRRLKSDPLAGIRIVEHGALSDAAVAELMTKATALLFPSIAEGFGLPVLEALNFGLPVICADLPVLKETAGSAPLYLPTSDAHKWAEAILGQKWPGMSGKSRYRSPSWDDHFSIVFNKMYELASKGTR